MGTSYAAHAARLMVKHGTDCGAACPFAEFGIITIDLQQIIQWRGAEFIGPEKAVIGWRRVFSHCGPECVNVARQRGGPIDQCQDGQPLHCA